MNEGLSPDQHSDTALDHPPKRQKTVQHTFSPDVRHDQYTIAWICALHIEMAAARAMLDEIHNGLPQHADDINTYVLGRTKHHNIVIACLPHGQYGTNNAAIVITNLLRSFKLIRACLMVGIGGGVPSRVDVRLGDVVVGTRVMQCDLGKIVEHGQLQRTAIPRTTHALFGTAMSALRSKHELSPSQIPSILQQRLGSQLEYSRPDLPDRLFYATYEHIADTTSCDECDPSKLVIRSQRDPGDIQIHYGAIASSNQVMRNGSIRDDVSRQLNVICFEMETSGIMDIIPCIPIRGICDYSDSHKNKSWQKYAAATAAAYARELLGELPLSKTHTQCADTQDLEAEQNSSNEREDCLKRRQNLMAALQFKHINSREMNIESALSQTCEWFLSNSYYRAWLDPAKLTQHHGFLWLNGKPGAGKSTIMKFAYTSLKRNAPLRDSIVASYFFNARGEYLEKSVLGMYRSLLLHLLEGYPDLQIILDDSELVPRRLDSCPPLNVLKSLFYKAISALGPREFTCFIDALDECDEQQVVDMVHYFEELTEHISTKCIPFRICFSSRHYPYISIRKGLRLTLEEQAGHARDLATYVATRLRVEDPILAGELRSQLIKKASGVFMWVVLVVSILNKESRRGEMFLKKRLAELPSDLSVLFKDILRHDKDDMQALLLSVLWILYAKRPLHPIEFYHALWSGLLLDDLVDHQLPDVTASGSSAGPDRFERFVISSSKGLAEVTKSTVQTVQFIHESVRDFLIKDRGLYELWPEIGFDCESPGHEKLKQCCSLYLNHHSVSISASRRPSGPFCDREGMSTRLPFLEYASQHILCHANAAAKVVAQGEFLSTFPLRNWIMLRNLFEKYDHRRYTPHASLVYVLAACGHSELISTRLKDDPQIHIPGERYRFPLFAALARSNKDSATALLNTPSNTYDGLDITDGLGFRKNFKWYETRTPLSWAAENGLYGIVKLFILRDNMNVNEQDGEGRTPLSRAAANGHEAVVRFLLGKGAEDNPNTTTGHSPLLLALKNGHESVASLLLENGADVNCDTHNQVPFAWVSGIGHDVVTKYLPEKRSIINPKILTGYSPILLALNSGYEAVRNLLIERGAGVSFHMPSRAPPIWASKTGFEAVLRLILDNEADIDIKARNDQTPLLLALGHRHGAGAWLLLGSGGELDAPSNHLTLLTLASFHGYETVVDYLIKKGADVNAASAIGMSPLLGALLGGHDSVVKHLIDKGANLGFTESGFPSLLWSSPYGAEAAIRLLIENDAGVEFRDLTGRTPLSWASLYGHTQAIQLLITHGAEINSFDANGQTPLSWASAAGHREAVELLIEGGAELGFHGANGRDPFHLALRNAHEEVAVLLVTKGVDITGITVWGQTPLVYALRKKYKALLMSLVENGADTSALNEFDRCELGEVLSD